MCFNMHRVLVHSCCCCCCPCRAPFKQLRHLSFLDLRGTGANASSPAVLSALVTLQRCRQLCLSLGNDWDGATSRRIQGAGCDEQVSRVGELARLQSLRQLVLAGASPAVAEAVRALLPPWVQVR